jgi:hypothetical protein
MKTLVIALLAVALSGCDSYVEKSKYEDLQKQLSAAQKKIVEDEDALRKAVEENAQAKPGRYERFSQGLRQWRLDTATGSSCILLTSEEDWKKADTLRQGCDCEDMQRSLDSKTGDQWKLQYNVMEGFGCFKSDKDSK